MFGVTASTEFARGGMVFSPYLGLSGDREDIDAIGPVAARDVSQTQVSVGTRIDFQTLGAFDPHLSVGLDAWRFDDGATTAEDVTPSLGAGFACDTGTAGMISMDLAASEVAEDVTWVGVGLRHGFRFRRDAPRVARVPAAPGSAGDGGTHEGIGAARDRGARRRGRRDRGPLRAGPPGPRLRDAR